MECLINYKKMIANPTTYLIAGGIYVGVITTIFESKTILLYPGLIVGLGVYYFLTGFNALRTGVLHYHKEYDKKEDPKNFYFLSWLMVGFGFFICASLCLFLFIHLSGRSI